MKLYVYLFKKKGNPQICCSQVEEDSMALVLNFFYRHHAPSEWEIVQITLIS